MGLSQSTPAPAADGDQPAAVTTISETKANTVENTSVDFSERAIDVPADLAGGGGVAKKKTFAEIIKRRIINLEKPTSSFTSMNEITAQPETETAADDPSPPKGDKENGPGKKQGTFTFQN